MSIRSALDDKGPKLSELLYGTRAGTIRERLGSVKIGNDAKRNEPAPQYPKWVIVGCVVLAIVLFVWGFCRG